MPYNGNGTFQSLAPPQFPAVAGTVIRAAYFNQVINDLILGLTNVITRDGQTKPTNDLPMAGKKHTGVGDATAEDQYASYGQLLDAASLMYFTSSASNSVQRLLSSVLNERVSVLDFGAVGDWNGTTGTDDTAALTNAINSVNASGKRLFFPANVAGNYKISSALPMLMSPGGIEMEAVNYDNTSKGGIVVTGSGYTALTISGTPTSLAVAVYGTGNTANGLLLQNVQRTPGGYIRAANFDGFGLKINKCWDCVFDNISVELCGNATEYAFSMNDDGDTCNMTHISHLQVEQARQKAIYVSPVSLSCLIDVIHSEGATATAGIKTWVLGGNRCQYNVTRLASLNSAVATVHMTGATTTFVEYFTEGAITTYYEGMSGGNLTLITPEILGTLSSYADQVGTITTLGGVVNAWSAGAANIRAYGTKITALTIGYTHNNDPTLAQFLGCAIGTLASSSTTSAATFTNCSIAAHGSLLQSVTILRNCIVNNGANATLAVSYKSLSCYDTTINAPVAIDNGSIFAWDTIFNGTLTQTAGAINSRFNEGCYATGTVSGIGAPTGGAHYKGEYTKNMAPAVGSAKGWICSAAGTPGTWTSTGNL